MEEKMETTIVYWGYTDVSTKQFVRQHLVDQRVLEGCCC